VSSSFSFLHITYKQTDVVSKRMNLLFHKIQKAANSPNPGSLYDAAVAVRYADMVHLSKEQLRELEQQLHRLVQDANSLIDAAFPVVVVWEHSMGVSQDYCEFTTTRAEYDAHYQGYFTYLKVPDRIPWNPEDVHGVSPTVTVVNFTDVSPEWIPALANHYGIQFEAEKE
jgi:hypothetical protein